MLLNALWSKKALFIVLKVLFILALAISSYFLLKEMPVRHHGWVYLDKVQHATLFFFLTLFGLMLFNQHRYFIFFFLLTYGGLTEFFQSSMTKTRTGSVADWMADLVGILLACLLVSLFSYFIKRRQQHQRSI